MAAIFSYKLKYTITSFRMGGFSTRTKRYYHFNTVYIILPDIIQHAYLSAIQDSIPPSKATKRNCTPTPVFWKRLSFLVSFIRFDYSASLIIYKQFIFRQKYDYKIKIEPYSIF